MNVLIKTLVLVFVVSACPYQSLHGEEGVSSWKKHVIHSGEDCFTVIAADFTGDGRPNINININININSNININININSNINSNSNSNSKTRLFVNPDWQEIVLADHPDHGFGQCEVIDGQGNFTTHIVGRGQESYDLRAVDIDVDGHLDLLVAGRASQNVVWYENPAISAKTAP